MKVLVTGGLGFIGSNFIKYLLKEGLSDYKVCNIDSMSFGSNASNLSDYENNPRYSFIKGDINDISILDKIFDIDIIVNIAAETHVDRSISDPRPFIHSNYHGTFELLEYVRKKDIGKYVQISTDEVYGESREGYSFKETDSISPNNPYSASKAAADLLVKSYCRTYGLNAVITRCTNNFGPNQFPEKLVPKTIISILRNVPIFIYGNGKQIRDWIYVRSHAKAIYVVMLKGKPGDIYNISASNLMTNIEMINRICWIVKQKTGKETEIKFTTDRPGHDRRYSLDSTKIKEELHWRPDTDFDTALYETVSWYLGNEAWWKPLVNASILHPQPWKLGQRDNVTCDGRKKYW
jgi:dTDP-glucose 4,6-dehydratase